ncbi:MAG TPA: hypothetical protein VK812_10300 [Candidatus Binatus sp.]|nr:hypothetical protein [Candidatus Binatus sp.]
MKLCKADLVRMGLFLLFLVATVPAFCQRATLGLDVGEVSDKFAPLPAFNGVLIDLNGEVTVIKPSAKNGGPAIVAGGELRIPPDTTNHAKEYALFGGVVFGSHNFSVGVRGEVRKIYMPPATLEGQVFNRSNMELFELPLEIKYKFGSARRAFISATGEPEFTPRFKQSPLASVSLPNPTFDYGYMVRGTVGYNFGKWYVKGNYESRYFKFAQGFGNPNSLYNWKSNVITGGVGLNF